MLPVPVCGMVLCRHWVDRPRNRSSRPSTIDLRQILDRFRGLWVERVTNVTNVAIDDTSVFKL